MIHDLDKMTIYRKRKSRRKLSTLSLQLLTAYTLSLLPFNAANNQIKLVDDTIIYQNPYTSNSNSLILKNNNNHNIENLNSERLKRHKRSLAFGSNNNLSKCKCQWTEWMNSHDPLETKNQEEKENLENLRKKYNFCQQPRDVNCRAATDELLSLGNGEHNCTLSGFSCNLFCFDFEVRFQCCQCIPEDISKSFRIHLYNNNYSLNTDLSQCLYYDKRSQQFKYGKNCNDDTSIFNWVSGHKLKVLNQCVSPSTLNSDARVILEECDDAISTQGFESKDRYISDNNYWSQIRLKYRYRYIILTENDNTSGNTNDKFTVKMHYTAGEKNNRFLAKLVTSDSNYRQTVFPLSAFSGRPCDKLNYYNNDPNGKIQCSFNNLVGSSCMKQCNTGYKLSSNLNTKYNTELICNVQNDSGESSWQDSVTNQIIHSNRINFPTCVKITCDNFDFADNIIHGITDCSNSNQANSVCKFSCKTGYQRIGPASTTCLNTGLWSTNDIPFCQKITCPEINLNHDSRLNYQCSKLDRFGYDSTCKIKCKEGFNLNGVSTTRCLSDGTWSNNFNSKSLSCGSKNCPEIKNNIPGLKIKCNKGRTTGSKCIFMCDTPKYEMNNNDKRNSFSICQSNGQWSNLNLPTCYNMACNQWNTFDSNIDITCRAMNIHSYSRDRRDNELPAQITSSTRYSAGTIDDILPNTICELDCNRGYTLKGSSTMKCSKTNSNTVLNSNWVDAKTNKLMGNNLQKCEIIKCPSINNFLNGSFKCYNTTKTPEYQSNSRTTRSLSATGLVELENKDPNSRFNYGSRCSFECHEGFTLEKSNVDIICTETSNWSNQPPAMCMKITCNQYQTQDLKNGKIICSEANNFGSICQFVCDPGYKYISDNDSQNTSECQKNGQWTNKPGICRPINCVDPFALDNRLSDENMQKPIISCSESFNIGSVCQYSCNAGYELNDMDASSLTCQIDGTWSGIAPICIGKLCDKLELPDIPIPNVNNLVEANRLCSDPGKEVTPGSRLYRYPSQCVFYCDPDYKTANINKLRCNTEGKWIFSSSSGDLEVNTPPVCTPIQCPPLETFRPGTTINCTNDNKHKSVCKFECNKGYIMTGSDSISCNREGWSSFPPICDKITCDPLKTLEHGDVDCQDTWSENQLNCKFKCHEGYELVGQWSELKCTAKEGDTHGEWNIRNYLESWPTCQPFKCPALDVKNLNKLECKNTENHVISPENCNYFGCTCKRVCSDLETVKEYDSVTSCVLQEDPTTGQKSVQWSGKLGQCELITCPSVKDHVRIANSESITCTNKNIKDSVCTIKCPEYFRLVGPESFTCQADGKWTNYDYNYCEQITCSHGFSQIMNGNVHNNKGNLVGSTYTFECDEGYRLLGEKTIECLYQDDWDDGRWSHESAPSCQEIFCREPKIHSGRVSYFCNNQIYNYGTECEYRCEDPKRYALIGESKITCSSDIRNNGVYKISGTNQKLNSNNIARCEIIRCPSLADPEFGRISCTNSLENPIIGTKCKLSCDQNYKSDFNNLECIKNPDQNTQSPEIGVWVDLSQTERPKGFNCMLEDKKKLFHPCSVPEEKFSEIYIREEDQGIYKERPSAECNYVTKECDIKCPFNFEPSVSHIYCNQESQSWDTDITKIICSKKTCSNLPNIDNTFPTSCTDENFVNSNCEIKCIEGYDLIGLRNLQPMQNSINLQCQSDGQWSRPITSRVSCQQKRCFKPFSQPLQYIQASNNQIRSSSLEMSCSGYEESHQCSMNCPSGFELRIQDRGYSIRKSRDIEITCGKFDGGYYWSEPLTQSKYFDMDVSCQEISQGGVIILAAISVFIIILLATVIFIVKKKANLLFKAKGNAKAEDKYNFNIRPENNDELGGLLLPGTTTFADSSTLMPNTTTITTDGAFTLDNRNEYEIKEKQNLLSHKTTRDSGMNQDMHSSGRGSALFDSPSSNLGQNSNLPLLNQKLELNPNGLVDQNPNLEFNFNDFINYRNNPKMAMFNKLIGYDKFENAYTARDNIEQEFNEIPKRDSKRSAHAAKNNEFKSRYSDIDCYDYNRIKLPISRFQSNSGNVHPANPSAQDFINASYISGFNTRKYIAAMGPKTDTIHDFWTMIWSNQISVIVMLTNFNDLGQEKCAKYWPHRQDQYIVEVLEEIQFGDFIQRKFRMYDHTINESREIYHYQFTSWPDFGVPLTSYGIIKLIKKIKLEYWEKDNIHPLNLPPIVVHCSAGVGRTGTFIALDVIYDHMMNETHLLKDKAVNLFSLICHLRKQRPHLVQSFDQYNFLYKSILTIYQDGDTEIEVSELNLHFLELSQLLPGSKTGLLHEFEKLDKIQYINNNLNLSSFKAIDFENQNYSAALVPYDNNIVDINFTLNNNSILPISDYNQTSEYKYINASWINGYFIDKSFIATQTPLPNTKNCFWHMAFIHKSEIIVCLESANEMDSKSVYFPNTRGEVLVTKDYKITCLRNSLYDNFENILPIDKSEIMIVRELEIKPIQTGFGNLSSHQMEVDELNTHYIYHIQIRSWNEKHDENSSQKIVDILNTMERIIDCTEHKNFNSEEENFENEFATKPVIVHCQGGCGRTGSFLTINNCVEQVKTEGTVDVYQTVKKLRLQRRKMVQILEEYKFCYLCILSYIDSMGDYANFK